MVPGCDDGRRDVLVTKRLETARSLWLEIRDKASATEKVGKKSSESQ